jgi:hypothetical protein
VITSESVSYIVAPAYLFSSPQPPLLTAIEHLNSRSHIALLYHVLFITEPSAYI